MDINDYSVREEQRRISTLVRTSLDQISHLEKFRKKKKFQDEFIDSNKSCNTIGRDGLQERLPIYGVYSNECSRVFLTDVVLMKNKWWYE